MTSCLMRPALLKCYRRYVVFCKNVHMRKGHRCHRHNDLIPSYAIHYLRSFWRAHMSIWECILGRVQKFTSVNYTTQACAEHLQTHTHICHTQWFTCRVLHPGWGIRPSCLMIWVWRSSVRQRGDCWSVRTAAGFTDAQRERDRETHLIGGEWSFLWYGWRVKLYTCMNLDIFFTIVTFFLEYCWKFHSIYCRDVYVLFNTVKRSKNKLVFNRTSISILFLPSFCVDDCCSLAAIHINFALHTYTPCNQRLSIFFATAFPYHFFSNFPWKNSLRKPVG